MKIYRFDYDWHQRGTSVPTFISMAEKLRSGHDVVELLVKDHVREYQEGRSKWKWYKSIFENIHKLPVDIVLMQKEIHSIRTYDAARARHRFIDTPLTVLRISRRITDNESALHRLSLVSELE